jgi:DNA uptake protein ComE-like DNA-binding protein
MRHLFVAAIVAAAAICGHAQAQEAVRLNANAATGDQLKGVPGLTEAQVAAILTNRPFADTAAYDAAVGGGLTPEQKAALYARIFVPIDLNKAPRNQIMLIPGMTRRMAHEFEEYRPYKSLDQFNKEIGKYVDAAEVARLRSYVELK